jgi:hypothetical protein
MKLEKKKLLLISSSLLWLGMVGIGLSVLWQYENAPGIAATPFRYWPANSGLQRAPGRATLVMLAHPQCPCTRSSLGELALLMAQCQGRVDTHVLFYRPEGFAEEWARTDLWQSAVIIPGVTVHQDVGGIEALRFHAETSGQVLLYDAAGQLIFSGGITSSRGHSGDNAGRSAIASLLTEGRAERDQTFVFGCSLVETQCPNQKGEIH